MKNNEYMNIFLDFVLQSVNLFSYQQLLFAFTDFRVKYGFWQFKFSSPQTLLFLYFPRKFWDNYRFTCSCKRLHIGKSLAHFPHFSPRVTFSRIIVSSQDINNPPVIFTSPSFIYNDLNYSWAFMFLCELEDYFGQISTHNTSQMGRLIVFVEMFNSNVRRIERCVL